MVSGQRISESDLTAYVQYAGRFYQSAYGVGTAATCAPITRSATCAALTRQALARLIEERIAVSFARSHGITLSNADRAAIAIQMRDLSLTDATTRRLLRERVITRAFLRGLLETEALVRKLEGRLTDERLLSGSSFHIRSFTIPLLSAGSVTRTYHQAQTLAVDGGPVPRRSVIAVRWVADFRLPAPVRIALRAAADGDFAGPFRRGSSYLVIQRLAAGTHRYGAPARLQVETRVFQTWLSRRVLLARPICYTTAGSAAPCPAVG
jgi:hypothetical protein